MAIEPSEKRDWLVSVLGASLPLPGAGGRDEAVELRWRNALAGWQSAIEAVDGQIAALQGALRSQDDPALKGIAESGLNAVTGDFKVPLMAALEDVRRASGSGRRAACAKAQKLAVAFGKHIAGDPRVAACNANPFGVPVSIVGTLGPALDALELALSDAEGDEA